MSRFSYAIDLTMSQLQPLRSIAKNFARAIEEAEVEGLDPMHDPAVLILGSFIAFQTHADVNTRGGYHKLIAMCHDRINATPPEVQ